MYSQGLNGRLKVRLRNKELHKENMNTLQKLLPELKEFLNSLPLKDRMKSAWRILLGRF